MQFPSWRRQRQKREEDLAAEIRSHLDMAARDRIERGSPALDAERSARHELGNVALVQEVTRDTWGWTRLEQLAKDAHYGLRAMLRNPRFTIVAILTLALGIGANSAIFSMVNALIRRPYTFRDLERLVLIRENDRGEVAVESLVTGADAADLARDVKIFDALTVYRFQDVNLAKDNEVNSVIGAAVSANFFELLGEKPILGRAFARDEDQAGRARVALLGYGLWKGRFGADPNILGATIQLNGQSCTVIGVMPAGFNYPLPAQIWTPLALRPDQWADRKSAIYGVLGRLKGDITLAQAGSSLEAFSKRLQEQYPATNAARSVTIIRLREELYRFTVPLFSLLELAAVFVLALACANLTNLMMARLTTREKELALRMALGANRRRLAQLIVMESVLLSLAAGAIALAVSYWSVDMIRTSISEDYTKWIPGWDRIHVDLSVAGFGLLVSMIVGILIGLVAAARGDKADPYERLKEGARGATSSASKHRLRNALVIVQMILAMVLLVGATLMIKGFLQATDMYQALHPSRVLIFEVSLPESRYREYPLVVSFYDRALRELRAMPGVRAATVATNMPASNVENGRDVVRMEGRPNVSLSEMPAADLVTVGPQFLEALSLPLIRGRAPGFADGPSTQKVVMINQRAAQQFWPRQDPIGRRLKLGADSSTAEWLTVVGVCGDMKQNWWNAMPSPTLYLPYQQMPQRSTRFAMRVSTGPSRYAAAVREVIHHLDPQLALNEIHSYEKEVADSLAIIRVIGMLMTIFGVVALVLAAVGLYGLVAYGVSQRTQEFGIRVALGASRFDVLNRVLTEALVLSTIGVAIGLPLSFVLNKAMGSSIFGLVQFQAVVPIAFAALLIMTSLLASLFPALRATRVDPIVALRYE